LARQAIHETLAISTHMNKPKQSEFERAASETSRGGFLAEFWGFMKQNKKWWLLPLLLALLLFGVLIFLSGTGLAPFIYTLF
jgi:drug/metabolite transporter superfamily protein YnfA